MYRPSGELRTRQNVKKVVGSAYLSKISSVTIFDRISYLCSFRSETAISFVETKDVNATFSDRRGKDGAMKHEETRMIDTMAESEGEVEPALRMTHYPV